MLIRRYIREKMNQETKNAKRLCIYNFHKRRGIHEFFLLKSCANKFLFNESIEIYKVKNKFGNPIRRCAKFPVFTKCFKQ